MLGPHAANHLVERLAGEPDRANRSRLLEALKSCGQVAEAPLLESLKSNQWFVVRNALIVLGEVAGPTNVPDILPCLNHKDPRVQSSAIRTVGRLGGRTAESALIPLLAHKSLEIQSEVLFALGELNSKQAVPAVLEFVKAGKGKVKPEQEQVREKAIELLGALGSPTAAPLLQELLTRHKGFFRESKEPVAIRVAALKALLALGETEAQDFVNHSLEAEPKGPDLEALQKAFVESLSGQ
jgi:HEAT repeat protein